MENYIIVVFFLTKLNKVFTCFGNKIAIQSYVQVAVICLDLEKTFFMVGFYLEIIEISDLFFCESSKFIEILGIHIGARERTCDIICCKDFVSVILCFYGLLNKKLQKNISFVSILKKNTFVLFSSFSLANFTSFFSGI